MCHFADVTSSLILTITTRIFHIQESIQTLILDIPMPTESKIKYIQLKTEEPNNKKAYRRET